MKTLFAIGIVLASSTCFGQVAVTPLSRAHARVLVDQEIGLRGLAEQARHRAEWIESLPDYTFTRIPGKEGPFTGKFIEVKNNRAMIQLKSDGVLYGVPLAWLTPESRKYIREETRLRRIGR